MTIEEIKKILGITTLDEAQQTLLTEKLEMMIDVKAKEKAEVVITEEKERLVEEYETKFEEYKKDITSKFSNFVDSVLDEELEIPEKVLEYARKGELYEDVITDLKKRLAIDEGVLTDEIKDLLKEAKEEILKLKNKVNELTSENMDVTTDAKEMASQLYIYEKCKGLSEAKRLKVISLLGELRDKKEIDKKFDFVLEHIINEQNKDKDEEEEENKDKDEEEEENKDKDEEEEENKDKDEEEEEVKDGKGKKIVETEKDKTITEDTNPFDAIKSRWVKILKENKF